MTDTTKSTNDRVVLANMMRSYVIFALIVAGLLIIRVLTLEMPGADLLVK